MKKFKQRRITAVGALALAAGLACTASAEPWKFGVMADTQWTHASDAANPNSVAVSIINQLNPQFIDADVKFVVQVGDITDNGTTAAVTTHAAARQALYNAGIGFFPLRGNHESSQSAAMQFTNDFPQTQGLGANVNGAVNFSSAASALTGLSYSFDYNNARFVLLDQFTRLDGTGTDNSTAIVDQVPWVDATLSSRAAGTHAFVFAHKNLIGQDHTDVMFGGNPAANPAAQNAFIGSVSSNRVGYVLGGHDHVHHRSLVTSPDGQNVARQIICASDSSKFYGPAVPSRDQTYNNPLRELSVGQDLYRIGYYIFTVDGPQVTVDYYASDETFPSGNSPTNTPTLHFQKRETFGYSLIGQEFLVAQGQSYTNVQDSVAAGSGFLGTGAAIFGGSNGSTVKDGSARPLTKCVSTGWSPATNTASDVLTLLGLTDVGAAKTDTYTLALSYVGTGLTTEQLTNGTFALCTRNAYGRWIRAVDANNGGTNTFVFGPWLPGYGLGSYGVDTASGNVWAVVNQDGDFAAALTQIVQPGYVAGDFHQHTTYTDGSNPFATVMAKNNEFGLDWWANSEHGGKFPRNAAGPILTSGFDTGGYAQFWDVLGVGILGDPTGLNGGHTNMWRWQSLRDSSFADVQAARTNYPNKTIIQGVEWNVPGHEHCSVGLIANEFGTGANAQAAARFEYLWDAGDTDVSGGLAQGWTGKITVNNHVKATNAVAWMQANFPTTSWMVPAHPERKGGRAGGGYDIADFRDMNNAGPGVCFGFESMPGHQKDANRGGYTTGAFGGTFGGCGFYAAKVGGLWDAMLGEGRSFWLFASSDFHNTVGDFWPGEYQKNHSYVADKSVADSHEAAQQIVDSLRSGRNWVVEGDLIDALEFTAAGAVMGSKVFVTSNTVTLSITVHDPQGTNYGPLGYNMPVLDHIDVIAGDFGGPIAPNSTGYTNDVNATTRVIARFDATGGATDTAGLTSTAWTDLGSGWKQMSLTLDTQGRSTYFRLRGSNLGLGVANETDGAGNPLPDSLLAPNDTAKAFADLWFYSNPVFVQVNQAPTVVLDSPTNNASFTQGYTVGMAATATDDGTLAGVSFYANHALLSTDTSSPYAYYWAGAPVGTHLIKAVATDGFGITATSTVATITVVAPTNTITVTNKLEFSVKAASDDAEEYLGGSGVTVGFMDIPSSDLELIQDGSRIQLVGMRFTGVNIPKDAKILDAYIQFTCDEFSDGKNLNPFNVRIRGEAADNSSTFTTNAFNMSSRAFTTNSATWADAPEWRIEHEAGPAQRTPSLAALVQEIKDRAGWTNGNAMTFMIDGQGCRCAEAFEGEPTMTPKLVVVAVRETSFGVVDNSDDAEENLATGAIDLASSDMELIQDGSKIQMVGLRFANVSLPAGAELVYAYIQFTCDATDKNISPVNLTIRAEAADSPVTYSLGTSNITSRPLTTASVAWNDVPTWTVVGEAGPAQRTPNLVSLVSEVMARPGWTNGNAMAFTLVGQGNREAEARDSGTATAPKLVLVYAGGYGDQPPQAPVLSITQSNGNAVVTWPMQGAEGYELQFSPDINGTNWVPVNGNGFFRLVK